MIISKRNIQFKMSFTYQKQNSQSFQCSSFNLTLPCPMMPFISQIVELASLYNQLSILTIFHGSQRGHTIHKAPMSQLASKPAKLPNLHRISKNPSNRYYKPNC